MYQFIHINTYARTASKKIKPTAAKNPIDADVKRSASEIISEALRDAGNCPHVENPEKPTFLEGSEQELRGLLDEIEQNIEKSHKLNGGRRLRADAHVLLAGVASFPRELAESEPKTFEKWRENTLFFLKDKYGEALRAVVFHDDEEHPHIHFYVCDKNKVNAKDLHPGYIAAQGLGLTKEGKRAYIEAMRNFQSEYYAKVGHESGLMRDGPARRRETRQVYKARQREERERVALSNKAQSALSDAFDEASQLAKKAKFARSAAQNEMDQARAAQAAASAAKAEAEKRLEEAASLARRADEAKRVLAQREERAAQVAERNERTVQALKKAQDLKQLTDHPEHLAMLRFIESNPDIKAILTTLKNEPAIISHIAEALDLQGFAGEEPTDWLATLEEADRKALEAASTLNSSGLEFK